MITFAHITERPRHLRRRRSLAQHTAIAIGRMVAELLANEELARTPGLLQNIDPRVRLVSVLALAVTVSFLHSLLMLATVILSTMLLAGASHVSVVSFATRVWATSGFLAVLLALPAASGWISPGHELIGHGWLSITAPGLLVATRLVLRVVAGAGIGMLIVWTMRWSDLLGALTTLRMPDVIVATLAMTQQQIVSLMRTVENIHLARESRMLCCGSAAKNREWVIGRMAFVASKSFKTADNVYDAMLARGFAGNWPTLSSMKMTGRDVLWLIGLVASCMALFGADRLIAQ